MEYVSDLHLHSRYSRAVSQDMILPTMVRYAQQKGLNLLSASDFTHPLWLKEIKAQLVELNEGVYGLQSIDYSSQSIVDGKQVQFLLSTEISSIYTQGGKLRRIHNLVFAPSLEVVEKINDALRKRGCNLNADGRPIIGLSSKNLLELVLSIDENCMLIPCHAWTPHFGIYGSKSGFDSISESFEDLANHVYAIETGISSDPEMNWRMKELTNRSILSFSDAHSPANMAREATVFVENKNGISNIKSSPRGEAGQISNHSISYQDIAAAIKRDPNGNLKVGYTVEFYPEEGKYHFSGHRNCGVSFSPQEVAEKGTKCPVCKREFTEGVAVRIEQLGGTDFAAEYEEKVSQSGVKWHTDRSRNHPPYVKLVRLEQIIGSAIGSTPMSMKTKAVYADMLSAIGNELFVLLKAPLAEITKVSGQKIADGVKRVREGEIEVNPGYDGEYGKVKIWDKVEKVEGVEKVEEKKEQLGLF